MFLEIRKSDLCPECLAKESDSFQKVKDYFQLISGQKRENKLYETKLIFVGRGEVGKTTLMKVLKNNKTKVTVGKEKTTHGINIDKIYF